jgi:hypothetical protein
MNALLTKTLQARKNTDNKANNYSLQVPVSRLLLKKLNKEKGRDFSRPS